MNTSAVNTVTTLHTTSNLQERLRSSYGFIQSLAVLFILVAVMSFISPRFATIVNFQNLMAQMAPAMIVAAGMAICMING